MSNRGHYMFRGNNQEESHTWERSGSVTDGTFVAVNLCWSWSAESEHSASRLQIRHHLSCLQAAAEAHRWKTRQELPEPVLLERLPALVAMETSTQMCRAATTVCWGSDCNYHWDSRTSAFLMRKVKKRFILLKSKADGFKSLFVFCKQTVPSW